MLTFIRYLLHFYSFLMDVSTDLGKIEDELVVIMTFCKDDSTGQIRSFARYFSVEEPKKADTDGLIACTPSGGTTTTGCC